MERTSDTSYKRDWPFLLGLGLIGLVLFFYRLGVPGLMDPDEGRYAEIAREFFVSRDWLIPHLNLLPYLEKPPLVYWLTALSFGALGESEFAARLPAGLSALGGIFLAYGLGRAFSGPAAGFVSGLILATSAGYVVMGRLLTLDLTLAFFLNLGVGLGYLALSRGRRRLMPWAYLALGLGVLTKGPVVLVLAGLIWGSWALLHRPISLRPLVHPWGWLLLGAVALPWFASVGWRQPDFLRFFFLEHHLGRYLTASIHPHQPFYYYVPVLMGLFLPWSFLLPWALWTQRRNPDPDRLFLLLWAGVIFIFFSLSRGKLASYVLPALLPLSLLLGRGLGDWQALRLRLKEGGLKLTLTAWGLLGWGLVAVYFWPPAFLAPGLAAAAVLGPHLPLTLAVLALTPTISLIWRHPGVLFLGALLGAALLPRSMESLSVRRSPREPGRIIKSLWQPGAALVGVRIYSQGLSFYSGQPMHLLDFRTELDFGRRLAPGSGLFFASPQEMAAFAGSRPLVFFFLKERELSQLKKELPGIYRQLSRYKDCLLVAYEGK